MKQRDGVTSSGTLMKLQQILVSHTRYMNVHSGGRCGWAGKTTDVVIWERCLIVGFMSVN